MDVGPILGILSIPRAHTNSFVGGQSESFTEILTIAKRMNCTAFVFGPFDINWGKRAVWGYRYNSETQPGEWTSQLFPLPTVIYNRIPNRTIENKEAIQCEMEHLRKIFGPRIFNPYFLDKWNTHSILYNNSLTSSLLPETRRLYKPKTVTNMLRKYGSVYLKPTANSLGNEMIKIRLVSPDQYYFVHQSLNNPRREGLAPSFPELLAELPPICDSSEYLIQQAIPLARVGNRPFDLRLLVQKNRRGEWRRTGLAARVAGEGSISTHVFYGGTRFPAHQAIDEAALRHGFSAKTVTRQLKRIVSLVPQVIEKSCGRTFGELEIDLGIDSSGYVWFFEANSKPFKFDEKLIRAKSIVRLIHYVHYLDALEL